MDDTVATTPPNLFARAVAAVGHPLLLAGALGLWWTLGANDGAMLATLASVLVVSMLLERLIPAEPAWRLGPGATLLLAALYLLGLIVSGALIAGYESLLPAALAGVSEQVGAGQPRCDHGGRAQLQRHDRPAWLETHPRHPNRPPVCVQPG